MANAVFDRVDADKDGKVTAEEAAEAHKKHFARVLAKVDKDSDHAISKQEAKVALVGLIKRFHASRDGAVKDRGECPNMRGKKPGACPKAKGKGPGKKLGKVDRDKGKAGHHKHAGRKHRHEAETED